MKIEHTATPNSQDIDFLTQKINQETPDFGAAHSFAFFMRDDRSEIIAGCNGSVIFGAIYTDQLWVHPNYRKQGIGKKLMEHVHGYGREMGCCMATLSTMSFQRSRECYERLGYEVDFKRSGYDKGATFYYLKKSIVIEAERSIS